MQTNGPGTIIKLGDFVGRNEKAKSSPIQETIKILVRQVNRKKLNYGQLKFILRRVREETGVGPEKAVRRLIELPTAEELKTFYSSIDSPTHRLIFETLQGTGLRVAELCSLKVERINFSANSAFVFQGKGRKDRIIVFGNRIREKLELYLEGRNNKFLFESLRHTQYSPRRIEQLCKKYKEKAGIQKSLTPHTFRHVWNTFLAEKNLSKERRMILAGHSSEKTQDI